MKEGFLKKIDNMDTAKYLEHLNIDHLMEIDDLESLIQSFETNARAALEVCAPLKEKLITTRYKNPWFSEELQDLKREVRKYERIWKRNNTQDS